MKGLRPDEIYMKGTMCAWENKVLLICMLACEKSRMPNLIERNDNVSSQCETQLSSYLGVQLQ